MKSRGQKTELVNKELPFLLLNVSFSDNFTYFSTDSHPDILYTIDMFFLLLFIGRIGKSSIRLEKDIERNRKKIEPGIGDCQAVSALSL